MTGAVPGDGVLRLVVASANRDKAAEIVTILGSALGPRIELLARPDEAPDVEESGSSFQANARLKATALVEATGQAAVADDSGLEVDALGGAPGIHSARFAGPDASYGDNIDKLLANMAGRLDRTARFRTVALVVLTDGTEIVAEGVCEGVLAERPTGTGGFGYDPVFVADAADGRSFAELAELEKHALSARGQAFRTLASKLGSLYGLD